MNDHTHTNQERTHEDHAHFFVAARKPRENSLIRVSNRFGIPRWLKRCFFSAVHQMFMRRSENFAFNHSMGIPITMKDKTILAGLKQIAAYEKGEHSLRTRVVEVVVDVKAIREKLELSQEEFCRLYGFPLSTLKNWEQGRRKPDLAARLLLGLIGTKPEVVAEELRKMRKSG